MNQPIIKDMLRQLEIQGKSWVFNQSLVEDMYETYSSKSTLEIETIPGTNELSGMLGTSREDLSQDQLKQQTFILKEFLKYTKMAGHLFLVQQGTNMDTATLNDPFLVLKNKSN